MTSMESSAYPLQDTEIADREQFCYLTTAARRTGAPHSIEIWFAGAGASLFLVSGAGDRSDWVTNLLASGAAGVRIGDRQGEVRARVPLAVSAERDVAIDRLHQKYGLQVNDTVEDWRRGAFIVALDLAEDAP